MLPTDTIKTTRIDGKDYELGSEAHLEVIERKHANELQAVTSRADAATKDLDAEKAAHDATKAQLKAEKDRADAAEAKAKPEALKAAIERGVRVQVLAAKSGVQTVKKDGKDVDVADADQTAVLLAIAKKAMPDIDVTKLNLTPEQLLELIAQKVGASAAASPAPTDGDMPAEGEEEEEAPMDGRRGDARDPFAVLNQLEGLGTQKPDTKKAKRTYQDAHDAMEQRIRAASERKRTG